MPLKFVDEVDVVDVKSLLSESWALKGEEGSLEEVGDGERFL